MSQTTYKNIKPQRKYRERSQPESRSYLGLLEKKKDYQLRSKHFHKKEDKLNKLRLKASLKNDDEFYFKMIKGKQEDGKHVFASDEEDENFDQDEFRKILKTQNGGLVKVQKQKDNKKVANMQQQLQMLDMPKENNHTVYVDSKDQFDNFDLVKFYNTVPELVDQKYNILTKDQLEKQEIIKNEKELGKLSQQLKQNYKKLVDKKLNEQKMEKLMLKLDLEKQLIGKERKRLKKYKTGKVYKFFQERKK